MYRNWIACVVLGLCTLFSLTLSANTKIVPLSAAIFLSSAIPHESSHALTSKLLGADIKKISILPTYDKSLLFGYVECSNLHKRYKPIVSISPYFTELAIFTISDIILSNIDNPIIRLPIILFGMIAPMVDIMLGLSATREDSDIYKFSRDTHLKIDSFRTIRNTIAIYGLYRILAQINQSNSDIEVNPFNIVVRF